jgi:hypothetical protein
MNSSRSMGGISLSLNETLGNGSFNESLSINADNEALYFQSFGMAANSSREKKLTLEGAAGLYWGVFIEPLRR